MLDLIMRKICLSALFPALKMESLGRTEILNLDPENFGPTVQQECIFRG